MNPITLNAVAIRQPTRVRENQDQIQTDQVSISGSRQRDRMGKKNRVDLSWEYLSTVEARTIMDMFEAGTVDYVNTLSDATAGTLAFTGLATFEKSDYLSSGDTLVILNATILEV